MNANRGEASQANFETPPQGPESQDNSLEKVAEAPAAAPEKTANQPQTLALPIIPDDIPAAGQPALPVSASDDQTAQGFAHAAVADGDHIPEVWIDKIKSVIAQTHQDPYIQKNEVSKIKAEYIQKRFNKEMKADSGGE